MLMRGSSLFYILISRMPKKTLYHVNQLTQSQASSLLAYLPISTSGVNSERGFVLYIH